MRMKMFTAETIEAAKALIFSEMGQDAVILSERQLDGHVEVRAATDKMGGGMVPSGPDFLSERLARSDAASNGTAPLPFQRGAAPSATQLTPAYASGRAMPGRARVRDALLWHGAPEAFAHKVAGAALLARGAQNMSPADSIECGLETLIACDPVPVLPARPLLLVGAPGHGRTATAAKLARRAAVAGRVLCPVAADFDGAAGGEQLRAYLAREAARVRTAASPGDLFPLLKRLKESGSGCVIDMPAIVPFDEDDISQLGDLLAAIDAEPVLVISAEGHPDDQAEAAAAFARLGVRRAVITKLDAVRRRGGIVSALSRSRIALSHLAATPFIGGGLVPATPGRLAGLLVEDAPAHVALKGAA